MESGDRWLGLKQAAQYMGLSHSYVKRIWPTFDKYGVAIHRVGRRLLFRASDLDKVIEGNRIN